MQYFLVPHYWACCLALCVTQAQLDAQQSGDWRERDKLCGLGASEKCVHGVRRKASRGEERVAEEKVKQEEILEEGTL